METEPSVKQSKAKKNPSSSTQMYLKISEIRDNTLVLKNGGLRSVLRVSSINFNLKSEEEQNAIIYSYQAFLNTLEFPLQIVIRSKKLDIDEYLDKLKKIGEKQTNPLLQTQTYEYIEYIAKLVEYADIMEKDFLVVVPVDPFRSQKPNMFQKFFQNINAKDNYELDSKDALALSNTYAPLKTYGSDWAKLTDDQRSEVIKRALEEDLIESSKGDYQFRDEERAKAIYEEVLKNKLSSAI